MMRRFTQVVVGMSVFVCAPGLCRAELSLDQRLIVACFDVNVDEVVQCLRKGANVNARLGEIDGDIFTFRDRWTGETSLRSDTWTPLLALANSSPYPPPPDELGDVRQDTEKSGKLLNGIPKAVLDARAESAMTIMRILLSNGCRLKDRDKRGADSLHIVASENRLPLARMLLKFGADPNVRVGTYFHGPHDRTALHEAYTSKEMLQLLLDHGADASAKDSDGKTPADWVALDDDRTFDLLKTRDGWRIVPRIVSAIETKD